MSLPSVIDQLHLQLMFLGDYKDETWNLLFSPLILLFLGVSLHTRMSETVTVTHNTMKSVRPLCIQWVLFSRQSLSHTSRRHC